MDGSIDKYKSVMRKEATLGISKKFIRAFHGTPIYANLLQMEEISNKIQSLEPGENEDSFVDMYIIIKEQMLGYFGVYKSR